MTAERYKIGKNADGSPRFNTNMFKVVINHIILLKNYFAPSSSTGLGIIDNTPSDQSLKPDHLYLDKFKHYVILPTLISMLIYASLKLSYHIFVLIFNNGNIALVFNVLTFSLFCTFWAPGIVMKTYNVDFWNLIKVEKHMWIRFMLSTFTISILVLLNHETDLLASTSSNLAHIDFSFDSQIMAPVFEELLFRGVLLGLSERILNRSAALRLNALLFGVWHLGALFLYGFSINVVLFILLTIAFGYLLALIHINYRQLWIVILLHSLATSFKLLTGFPSLE